MILYGNLEMISAGGVGSKKKKVFWYQCLVCVLITVYLVLQWRTLEIASQSQKTLCQIVLMTMTTLWQRSVAPSAPDRSCVNSLMSITWFSEYFSSRWTTVSSSAEKVHVALKLRIGLFAYLQKCPFQSSTLFCKCKQAVNLH